MELLERAVLPWMQRCERISGQGKAARGDDAWPQRTGARQGEAAHRKQGSDDVHTMLNPPVIHTNRPPLNYSCIYLQVRCIA